MRASPAVSTYFLFSNTPPHALDVMFVVSARIGAKINQNATECHRMIPTRLIQQQCGPWELVNFANLPADDSLHKRLPAAFLLGQFIARRPRKSIIDIVIVLTGCTVFGVRVSHFQVFWVNGKIRFSTQKEKKKSLIMFLCHFVALTMFWDEKSFLEII